MKVKVIFRKTNDNEIIAFFPEIEASYGCIMSYMHIGQHGEASYDFYTCDTKMASESEYIDLFNELKLIYNDCELIVKQKINYNDLLEAWKIRRY